MALLPAKKVFNRFDGIVLAVIGIIALCIYLPVFYTDYLYTDEATQVWLTNKGLNLTSIPQGRWFTYLLFKTVFSRIHTIHGVSYVRIIALVGWLLVLPLWYYILKKTFTRNGLHWLLAACCTCYLVCMPSFAVSVGWSACFELFIACSLGLLSGHTIYNGIRYTDNTISIPFWAIAFSMLAGIGSLFIYQNAYSFFFIPFFIEFISCRRFSKSIFAGLLIACLTYIVYYILFKQTLHAYEMPVSDRGAFSMHPINKLLFFFARPLASAFHFTWLFNEKSIIGEIIYMVLFIAWLLINFIQRRFHSSKDAMRYAATLLLFFLLAYLPSLLVVENFASHRTLFALNMMVFIMVAETIFFLLRDARRQMMAAVALSVYFSLHACYNFRVQFLYPLEKEYTAIRQVVSDNYSPAINSICFISPAEDAFVNRYGLVASWDEFGVPSTAKPWVPEPLVRQIIFEKTGNRALAEKISFTTGNCENQPVPAHGSINGSWLVIDARKMVAAGQ